MISEGTSPLYTLLYPAPTPLTTQEIEDNVVAVLAESTPPPAYSAQVYQIILPSLVIIQTQRDAPKDTEDEENMEGFGVGTGVVVSANSDILTAYHVVADAAEIDVIFADGTRANAEIIVIPSFFTTKIAQRKLSAKYNK